MQTIRTLRWIEWRLPAGPTVQLPWNFHFISFSPIFAVASQSSYPTNLPPGLPLLMTMAGTSLCHWAPLSLSVFRRRSYLRRRSFLSVSSQLSTDTGTIGKEFEGRVGFLGMGIMGSPMALNLIKAGGYGFFGVPVESYHYSFCCDVTVWNRTKSKCDHLINLGAKFEFTPAQVASSCDVTFAMLADPDSAVAVATGENGAVQGLASGKGYIDVSTVDGATSKLICESVKKTGASFLEAPVSGSKKPAEDGQLIFLTAGDETLYERVASLLDIMGKSRFYLGDVGNGAAMKLVVNMIMGSMMASFSEGLLLAEKVGLDPNDLVEVVSQGAISSPMYSLKGPAMVKATYPTAFPLKHQQKDLRLALGLAESVSQPIPIAAAANELYKVAKSQGLSDHDFSAVIEALKAKLQN